VSAGAQPRSRGRPPNPGLAEQRREQILDAATDLFAREGYEKADLQHAASALGIAKGTIYRYFPSKERLFLAAVDRVMRRLMEAIERARESVPDPVDKLAAGIEAYLRFFDANPHCIELLIQERAGFRDRKKPTYFEYRDANRPRARDVFGELIAAGRVRNIPVERITEAIGAALYGAIFTNYMAGDRVDPARQARDLTEILFHGILNPGATPVGPGSQPEP
jgi:AcrR family transcriptional regulator